MDRATNNRMVLLLIAGIPVTVILVSTWLWWFVVRGDLDLVGMLGTANRGDLVQPPRQLEQASLYDSDGRVFELRDAEPRWAVFWYGGHADRFGSAQRTTGGDHSNGS